MINNIQVVFLASNSTSGWTEDDKNLNFKQQQKEITNIINCSNYKSHFIRCYCVLRSEISLNVPNNIRRKAINATTKNNNKKVNKSIISNDDDENDDDDDVDDK